MKPYIITTGATAGRCVLFGYSDEEPEIGDEFRLERARMVIYWPSAVGGLLGLAGDGPKGGLRLSGTVTATRFHPVREVIEVEHDVAEMLSKWPTYVG